MTVSRIELKETDLYVIARGVGRAAARLIVRERKSKDKGYWNKPGVSKYLYLVYRAGEKIRELYIGKLA